MTEYIATSIARRLIVRMQATHERRRISVFAGPPGIGKTTAIEEFATRQDGHVVIVKIARRNAKELLLLQHLLEAVRRLTGSALAYISNSVWELRKEIFDTLCGWAGFEPLAARRGRYGPELFPRMTIVFDEAQNLSSEAIEALRYWNDSDRCYSPFPLGVIFVGNSEFSLAGGQQESVISAAVADRALYLQTYDYEDVTDDDLRLFIEAQAEIDEAAVALLLRSFRGPRSIRSLRRVSDLLGDLLDHSGAATITAEVARSALLEA